MRYAKYFCIIFLIQITFSGCRSFKSKKEFTEGTIEYAILFEENVKSNFNSSFLPNKLTIKFCDNNTSNRIEGLSGAFNLTYINNIDDNNGIILVKVLNKKLYYEQPLVKGGLPNTYAGMPKIIIKETGEIVHFQGFKCKRAVAFLKDSSNYSFDILYTNEIKIANPNANTPFDSIDGVMLQFKVKLYNHIMAVSASSILQERISKDEFSIPSEYEEVSKRTIDDLLSLLQ